MQPMAKPKLTMDEEEVVEGEDTQTGASGNWTAKASKYNRRQTMIIHFFPLVELIFSHGKDVCGCLLISYECSVLRISPLERTCELRAQ